MTVRDYDTGNILGGSPSDELVEESMAVDTWTVGAWLDGDGVWQYVPQHLGDHAQRILGRKIITVWVEE